MMLLVSLMAVYCSSSGGAATIAGAPDATAPAAAWKQPVFAVGIYMPGTFGAANPQWSEPERLLATHNFSFGFMGLNATLCTRYGLGCLKTMAQVNETVADLPPSIWGFNVADEPGVVQFPQLGEDFVKIRALYGSAKMGFANMLETYCPGGSLSQNPLVNMSLFNYTETYENYAERYVTEVQPSFLCMDYYPYFEPQSRYAHYNRLPFTTKGRGEQNMQNYLNNVLILRTLGLKHGLSWWNYFGAAGFQGHTAVTEKQLELQMSTSIATGARGLLYWMIGEGDTNAGWRYPRGRHWAQALRLNSKVKALGPTLMRLRSTAFAQLLADDARCTIATAAECSAAALVTISSISETNGCAGQTTGGAGGTAGDVSPIGGSCHGRYRYESCGGMLPAGSAALMRAAQCRNAVACSAQATGSASRAILHYPAAQCKTLCEASGGRGGAVGADGNVTAATACAAFATRTDGPVAADDTTCFLYSSQDLNRADAMFELVPSATLHVQVGMDSTEDRWVCPDRQAFSKAAPHVHAGYRRPGSKPLGYPRVPVVGGDFLLGEFREETTAGDDVLGRQALALVNWRTDLSAMATIGFAHATVNASDPATLGWPLLYEVDQVSGNEVSVADDEPAVPGLQLSLDAAELRLFLIGAKKDVRMLKSDDRHSSKLLVVMGLGSAAAYSNSGRRATPGPTRSAAPSRCATRRTRATCRRCGSCWRSPASTWTSRTVAAPR